MKEKQIVAELRPLITKVSFSAHGSVLILKSLPGAKGMNDVDLRIVRALSSLEEIDLRNTQITDDGLAYLLDMKNLKKLNLEGTRVSNKAVNLLQEALPDCDIKWDGA